MLREGYVDDVFVDGPLAAAMREGALLYVEEINRVPEETLNVLITVMSEGELHVPRLGRLVAAEGFRLVAAMNPFDAVGTARIASAIYDRTCRVRMDYQSADDEAEIVRRNAAARRTGPTSTWSGSSSWCAAPASHPDVRVGSSVRGAIDLVLVARSLAGLRGPSGRRPRGRARRRADRAVGPAAAARGLGPHAAEDVVRELWEQVFPPTRRPDDEPDEAG